MTPAARLQASIEILSALEKTAEPADKVVREYFRARRYAGSKDRASVAERVFTVLRHRYSYGWRLESDDPRRLVIASVLAEAAAETVAGLFSGAPYAPAALTDDERAAIAAPPREAPLNVVGEFPAWLAPELIKAFGPAVLPEMQAMLPRAPIDLRANTLKTSREILAAALDREGFAGTPTPWSPWGLRLSGATTAKLSASPLFATGQFEFQDEAAQLAALFCAAKPGSRVLDFAAGGGGKSLALAAAMRNQGELVAADIDPGRLAMLPPRATRAGASNITTTAVPSGAFDIVLLDSPCSGTGTWRRQPELRWRTTPERLATFTVLQSQLLDQASALVAPGGRLVYATCSILPCEDEDQITAFLARHPDFAPVPAADIWRAETTATPPPGADIFFRASPHTTGTDGFFTAILQRSTS